MGTRPTGTTRTCPSSSSSIDVRDAHRVGRREAGDGGALAGSFRPLDREPFDLAEDAQADAGRRVDDLALVRPAYGFAVRAAAAPTFASASGLTGRSSLG